MKTIRTVTPKECHWLSKTIRKGTKVYHFGGCTYGCIGDGFAATFDKNGDGPFFELPCDSVEEKVNKYL